MDVKTGAAVRDIIDAMQQGDAGLRLLLGFCCAALTARGECSRDELYDLVDTAVEATRAALDTPKDGTT